MYEGLNPAFFLQLKSYANAQGTLENWNSKYDGYTVDEEAFDNAYTVYVKTTVTTVKDSIKHDLKK